MAEHIDLDAIQSRRTIRHHDLNDRKDIKVRNVVHLSPEERDALVRAVRAAVATVEDFPESNETAREFMAALAPFRKEAGDEDGPESDDPTVYGRGVPGG